MTPCVEGFSLCPVVLRVLSDLVSLLLVLWADLYVFRTYFSFGLSRHVLSIVFASVGQALTAEYCFGRSNLF